MNTVSLCTIRGEDSHQMTVITLRMIMVLIGMIKLGHGNKCPWSCTMWQMSTWIVMMMGWVNGRTNLECILPCKVQMTITYGSALGGYYYYNILLLLGLQALSAIKIMSLNVSCRIHFWRGFVSSSETLCFPIFPSALF